MSPTQDIEDFSTAPTVAVAVESGNIEDHSPAVKAGFFLRWSRLVKSVEVRESTSGLLRSSIAVPTVSSAEAFRKHGQTTKVILNQVSGCAEPGQVVALMGPSGSGKTSLLNTLSGRSVYESGVISINGEPITANSMKRLMSKVAYVKQADIFFGHLTVRDQLTYTALLRLPSNMRTSDKHAEVNRILNLLRISNVADSPINLVRYNT
jgi:ABC-type multidrug transport system fused ATPase/permease subunit